MYIIYAVYMQFFNKNSAKSLQKLQTSRLPDML